MNGDWIVERKVNVSADISDYVYTYEQNYIRELNESRREGSITGNEINSIAQNNIKDVITREEIQQSTSKNLTIIDAMYDEKTGVAALAVKDQLTGETYLSYAGTNMKADGIRDVLSDASIGLNESLYLKQVGEVATSFYDRVQATGERITMVTGHSYGDFLASRVALERQVPYKIGYQGAPQFVTHQSLLYSLHKATFHQERQEEHQRLQELMANYSGYAVTFSTTKDLLTNVVWDPDKREIYFSPSPIFRKDPVALLPQTIYSLLYGDTGGKIEGHYPGQVVSIDVPIPHSMTAYRKSEEVMNYSKQVLVESLYGVDLNGDGLLEFMVLPEMLTTASLIPPSAGNQTIFLDTGAMRALTTNLTTCALQVEELLALTKEAMTTNEQVLASLSSRKVGLKEAIIRQMETICLVEAVQELDQAYQQLEDIESTLYTIAKYEPSDFSRKFDIWGASVLYDYMDQYGAGFSFTPITHRLEELTLAAYRLMNDIDYNATIYTGETVPYGMFGLESKTNLAKKGENLLNSFEDMVEESLRGLGRRGHFGDGVPEALQEILFILEQNLRTLVSCIQYLAEVVATLVQVMEERDQQLATAIQELDRSRLPEVSVALPQDYQTYLMESEVFDDCAVLRAFDDQIDVRAQDLAEEMSAAFGAYLDEASMIISGTNSLMNHLLEECEGIRSYFPEVIYYKGRLEEVANKRVYGRVREQIEIASQIEMVEEPLRRIDRQLTQASTTINTVFHFLGGCYQPFREGMEDAFYGAIELTGIVRSQKAVGQVLSAMVVRFLQFQDQLATLSSGQAFHAFQDKLTTTIQVMQLVTQVIEDCFGDEA